MTAPEKIYVLPAYIDKMGSEPMCLTSVDFAHMAIQYTRADLPQAAIAAAMMWAVKPLEWEGDDGFGPALPHGLSYFVYDESGDGDYSWELIANGRTLEDSGGVTWRSIGKARDGANGHYIRSVVDAISIPTDAMSALAERDKRVQEQADERAAYVVWSREHGCWWRANSAGYTTDVRHAGVYARAEALLICHRGRDGWSKGSKPDELPIRVSDLPQWAQDALKGGE